MVVYKGSKVRPYGALCYFMFVIRQWTFKLEFLIRAIQMLSYHAYYQKNGELKNIDEKPSFNYLANIGLYLLKPEITKLIPKNKMATQKQIYSAIKFLISNPLF